jgi:hypothetical protein
MTRKLQSVATKNVSAGKPHRSEPDLEFPQFFELLTFRRLRTAWRCFQDFHQGLLHSVVGPKLEAIPHGFVGEHLSPDLFINRAARLLEW